MTKRGARGLPVVMAVSMAAVLAGAVRVVDLPAFTAGLQFSLPGLGTYPCTDRFAADIAIQTGTDSVAAIVIGCLSSSGYEGVAIFDSGTMRPGALSAVYDYRTIAFGSSSVLYAYNNYTTGWQFSRLRVDAAGLSIIDTADGLLSGFGILLRSADGRTRQRGRSSTPPAGWPFRDGFR